MRVKNGCMSLRIAKMFRTFVRAQIGPVKMSGFFDFFFEEEFKSKRHFNIV